MKTIKPYGRSVVENDNKKREIAPHAQNDKITVKSDLSKKGEPIFDFLKDSDKFFIAQWASMLDKIINKQQSKDKKAVAYKNSQIYQVREKLSEAFIELWQDKGLQDKNKLNANNDFFKLWQLKAHPYKLKDSNKSTNKDVKKGRWYYALIGDIEPSKIDYKKVAENVYQHLYHNQKSISKAKFDKEKSYYPKGFIENKAFSITSNMHLSKNEQQSLEYLKRDITSSNYYDEKNAYKLDKLIDCLAQETKNQLAKKQKEDDERAKRKGHKTRIINANNQLKFTVASDCLYKHFGLIFKGEEIKDLADKNNKNHQLWLYHNLIKQAISQRYPKKPVRDKIYQAINADILHNLAINIAKNKMLSFAIRLGKVIHYSNKEGGLKNCQNITQIVNSEHWSSKKQTEIKQKESFIKQWLGALSVANSSLNNLIKKDSNIGKDIYLADFYTELKRIKDSDFNDKFKLLFGNEHSLYKGNKERDSFLTNLRKTIANIRHTVFHFKTEVGFKKALDTHYTNASDKDIKNFINPYIKNHLQEQQKLLLESLKSAGVEKYLSQVQLNTILQEIQGDNSKNIPLPKFNKLLRRSQNTTKALINAASQADLQKNPQQACAFICLKQVYQSRFNDYLQTLDIVTINEFLKKAQAIATSKAVGMNKKNALPNEKITAKMASLRLLNDNEKLLSYFSYLSAETASFFQVQQNTYGSNKKGAKKQSTFIEDFKQDFLILAFEKYLKDKDLYGLLKFEEFNSTSSIEKFTAYKVKEGIAKPWIYLILHLIPVEFVNDLSLQIKKYHVLKGEVVFAGIVEAIDLYISMHNAMLGIKSLPNYHSLMDFYSQSAQQDAEDIFTTNNEQLIPIKGLRELLRFGGLQQLQLIFADNKIKHDEIKKLQEYKKISNIQSENQELHQELCKKRTRDIKGNLLDKYKKYCTNMQKISQYNHLKNRVYLHNAKQIHQLMMTILGRFVGFSHLWERDIYFTMLAMLVIRGTDNNCFSDDFKKLIADGQIIAGLKKIKSTEYLGKIYTELNQLFYIDNNTGIRNNFAHFNDLRKKKKINLTKLLNDARQLTSYDRKIKNSVAKSIKELLLKNNVKIEFSIKGHELEFKKAKAVDIPHLHNIKIKDKTINQEKLQSNGYIRAVCRLFAPMGARYLFYYVGNASY